jgi:ABC-type transport system involved in multi-copper enzyme maturation permease subunit/peroxiredoxin
MAVTSPTVQQPSREAPSPASGSLSAFIALTRTEMLIGLRSPAFRFAAIVALIMGLSSGGVIGRGASGSAYATGQVAWQYFGFVVIIWMALTAVRDTVLRTDILVFSKPQPTERLVLSKFVGAMLQVLIVLLVLFVGAALSRLYVSGSVLGFSAYGVQYVRAAAALFLAASASFCLALLAGTPVAGALVALYWILAISGKAYLAKLYFPSYSQNQPGFIFVGIFLLCIALWFYRKQRRGSLPPSTVARLLAVAALGLAVFSFWNVIVNGHDPLARMQPALELMSSQDIRDNERTPGFMLPDQNGKLVSPVDYSGKILIIGLWTPDMEESSEMLAMLNNLHAKYGAKGVQPIAVAFSEDSSAGATYARGNALSYPVVTDWGTHNAPRTSEMSPVSTAYRTDVLPKVVVTDRSRNVRAVLTGTNAYDTDAVEQAVLKCLAKEPE